MVQVVPMIVEISASYSGFFDSQASRTAGWTSC
jgi:hypothetical protein